jgi:hypothetical protein
MECKTCEKVFRSHFSDLTSYFSYGGGNGTGGGREQASNYFSMRWMCWEYYLIYLCWRQEIGKIRKLLKMRKLNISCFQMDARQALTINLATST